MTELLNEISALPKQYTTQKLAIIIFSYSVIKAVATILVSFSTVMTVATQRFAKLEKNNPKYLSKIY